MQITDKRYDFLTFLSMLQCVFILYYFETLSGVRQGGVLSSALFAIFIDDIVLKVKLANVSCYVSVNKYLLLYTHV